MHVSYTKSLYIYIYIYIYIIPTLKFQGYPLFLSSNISLASAAVLESIGTYKISLVRHGNMDQAVKIRYVHQYDKKNTTKLYVKN